MLDVKGEGRLLYSMTEDESEDEIIDRIEQALHRLTIGTKPKRQTAPQEVDQKALAHSLDMLISRLRTGLAPSSATNHETE